MRIGAASKNSQSGYITLIIAMLVIIVGAIIIWKLARLMSQVLPAGSSTNSTQTYYSTNYGGSVKYQTKASYNASTTPSFSFYYGLHSSNGRPWITLTNAPLVPAGAGTELENDSNYYEISINMSSYSLYYKFDSNTGAQIDYASNGAVVLVIETSTNLVNWAGLATNQNAVPDFSYYYSDNANQPWAVYRIKTP